MPASDLAFFRLLLRAMRVLVHRTRGVVRSMRRARVGNRYDRCFVLSFHQGPHLKLTLSEAMKDFSALAHADRDLMRSHSKMASSALSF